MKINHLIIGTAAVEASTKFYTQILGFRIVGTFVDTGTGAEGQILVYEIHGKVELELLLVPFQPKRIPNPQHLALEVSLPDFQGIYSRSEAAGLEIRPEPPLDCPRRGIGECEARGVHYERFYLLDPGRVNIEIMKRLP